ncbi:DUF6800 family protein [Rubinisphaera italica]|uniref:Uncharacterized protein n=1 Tax=Rubinisphaera italica TaxID=2527969 RepID=A0A5C5XH86_9PLAN|nr:DUF6800 family protein [Rubinisphaera italica]TWT61791.1 hypothetical protein Pan54_25280 [Rubinisphaera italica]|tara:strand:- start:90 stop:260 length:171 start_codon:yes stop_codon:yes gene_type:complete
MPRIERDREMARKRTRKVKIAKFRAKYQAAKNDTEKQEILEKARKISPFIEFETAE